MPVSSHCVKLAMNPPAIYFTAQDLAHFIGDEKLFCKHVWQLVSVTYMG